MIVDLRDEGDHKEPIRLVISLKSNRVDAEEVMSYYLQLQICKKIIGQILT